MTPADIPAVPPVETPDLQGKRGISGDGGNRTHGLFPSSSLDLIRATALALRDLAEAVGATDATFTLERGAQLTWSSDDGFHLLPTGDDPIDISEWVDRVDFVPAEGVESVTQQPELLAKRAT